MKLSYTLRANNINPAARRLDQLPYSYTKFGSTLRWPPGLYLA